MSILDSIVPTRAPALLLALGVGCASAPASSSQTSPTLGGTAIVANQQSASATIIDVARQSGVEVPVGNGPHEAAISTDGKIGVVTIYGIGGQPGNQLAVIDLASKRLTRTIDLGEFRRPHGAAFLPGSSTQLVLTSEVAQRVVLVDLDQGRAVADIPTNGRGSHMLGITADGSRVYTANISDGSISEIDLPRRAFVRTLPVGRLTEGIAVAPDGSTVWVGSNQDGTVSVVDTRSWTVATTLPGFGVPYRIGISPDGRLAVVCDPQGNRIHIVDVASRRVVGVVDSLGSPRGVKVAPDNRTAFVTLGQEGAVAAVDLVDRTVRMKVPVGSSPDGVGFTNAR